MSCDTSTTKGRPSASVDGITEIWSTTPSTRPVPPSGTVSTSIVFEADTPAGKAVDVLLIVSILGSVIVVMLDSVETIHARSGVWLTRLEWTFTILFTVEYLVRLASVRRPWGYALSFFGVSAELVQAAGHQPVSTQACPAGSAEGHDVDAICCKYCGERLYPATV